MASRSLNQSPIIIVAVQSRTTGQWNYCPKAALPIIGRVLEYDDEPSGFATAQEALDAARKDKSIPGDARFEVQS